MLLSPDISGGSRSRISKSEPKRPKMNARPRLDRFPVPLSNGGFWEASRGGMDRRAAARAGGPGRGNVKGAPHGAPLSFFSSNFCRSGHLKYAETRVPVYRSAVERGRDEHKAKNRDSGLPQYLKASR